ncbi:hypothetical protein [Actinomyces sp. 565]|uniref:hypothetical protein n=1 Tax=Actinomyces sp. 565 TaxID=2057794 RepID=UPI00137448D1|nr:hypothetical protein [Actinomyces sp. 565]NDR53733.1 hypothetical protein [Actinomyces sp. 565]QHO91110.1 hypothetical protein CWT12_06920 [Actinomyces sp. 432]
MTVSSDCGAGVMRALRYQEEGLAATPAGWCDDVFAVSPSLRRLRTVPLSTCERGSSGMRSVKAVDFGTCTAPPRKRQGNTTQAFEDAGHVSPETAVLGKNMSRITVRRVTLAHRVL